MRDLALLQMQLSMINAFKPSNQAQQSRFAAARRADKHHELALFNGQVNAFDGMVIAKKFFNALELKISHGVS
jgi:hypothetical protein